MIAGWLRRKIVNPILDLLRQGITPEKIALSIALGLTLGVAPVLGSTSILCLLAAFVLGLNLPAIQLVNYLVYPLQLALLAPFFEEFHLVPILISFYVLAQEEGMWLHRWRAFIFGAAFLIVAAKYSFVSVQGLNWTIRSALLSFKIVGVALLYVLSLASLRRGSYGAQQRDSRLEAADAAT